MVLQRFRSVLTMLDSRGEGGGSGRGDYGGGEPGGAPPAARDSGPSSADLDDDIPF